MALKNDIGRLVKDRETLQQFLDNALCGALERRVVMIVGNRIVGDSRVLKSALSLAERGFEVVLVGMRPLPNDFSCGFIEGIPFVLANGAELSTGADAAGHAAAMKTIGQRVAQGLGDARFSILYTHDFWGLELGLHVMQANAYREALHWVHDVHEYIEGYKGILPEGRLEYAIGAEARYLGLPDQLVFVNERIADLLCARFGFDARERLVVHNAPRRQVGSAFQLRREIGLAPDAPLGVYLGRATAARGLDVLIPALKEIGELHFALLSSAAADYLAELRALAEKAGVAERLHIFEYVPDSEVASAVASASFGISPLTRYGNSDLAVPTKVLEFLHAELPMVVSDATFQADFVREHRLGEVFSSKDPSSFVAAVRKIVAGGYRPDWAGLQQEYAWDQQFGRVVQHLEARAQSGRERTRGVFQGPTPSVGQPGVLARGLRGLGVAAQAIDMSGGRWAAGTADAHWPVDGLRAQASLAAWAAQRFDLLHLHAAPFIELRVGEDLAPAAFQDLALLRHHGRRIVFQFRGGEARIGAEFRAANPFAWDTASDPSALPDELKRQLLERVRECADLILVPDPELQTYVPEARILQRAIELADLPVVGPGHRKRPRICHAPMRQDVHGKAAIDAALAMLKQQGLEFDFVPLDGLDRDALGKAIAESDIVIDQIVVGWYGPLAVEAMARGKAVLAYIRDDLVHDLPAGVLVNANPRTIAARLRELIGDAGLRDRLGVAARRFVESYHASDVVAARLHELYREAARAADRAVSVRAFAGSVDTALQLARCKERVAELESRASEGETLKAPAAKPAAPKPAVAKPAPAAKKPAPLAQRTLWQRLLHASPAKVANRIGRLFGGR